MAAPRIAGWKSYFRTKRANWAPLAESSPYINCRSELAKNLNDHARCLNECGACGFFASNLAPARYQGNPSHSFCCHSRPRSTIVATVPVHF
ncbi:hypothetical protein EXW72_03330 [Pseudomonas sp. BCA14]|nr:hypothetical protein EXW70_00360 [Pseudomonas sp. JMN1]TFF16298.1 hypothetical protein EXW71_08680 [Pseudomonas sp. BCA17]TFF30235.1 hypothetical protein EXW73_07915 [Pseudomonas sp. BCA13]TFF31076.1 hypothetical protein EXW72_03330 [Pseudomonas sp. BCA14]